MIILFDEDEVLFSSLGLGTLKDAISCKVSESLNDTYELEMDYPVDGSNFSKIDINKIIYCRPNPYSNMQPFRIYSISKPINGVVTVSAYHISYDMNGIAVNPVYGVNLRDTLDKIQNGAIANSNFKFYTDTNSGKTFKTNAPYNMRALIMGGDDSVLEKYDCEVKFDKFNVHILAHRGTNRGAEVRYAKNLTDLKHNISYDNLYNGVYPYYHKESTTVSSSSVSDGFKQVYIVGTKPYQDGWLSYTNGGEPYHPVDTSPVQIATEGDYNQRVFVWNPTIQRYEEKLYNQTVTLIEGVLSPDWIYIDWSKVPNIVCKSNVDGYFKSPTDTEWSYKHKDDIIFEGNIAKVASDITSNLIIYYSEVIPTASSATTDEESTITHIELKDKILKIDTPEATAMKHDRILMLDLSSEFDDENAPDEEKLKAKANEYIEKNKIGKLKFDTDVSFIDLSSTPNGAEYKDLEKVELGDTVKVIYEDLGIDLELRVISTEYDVMSGVYSKVELGEKSDTLSATSVQNGDDVSSLTNDVGYTDVSTVNKLIAKTVTADYIQAKNAKLSTAQITELETARINCTGILEASQLELDNLVAKMLTAENADIAHELKAGTVTIAGDITINSGAITITNGEKVFSVTRDGDLTANSVSITGGNLSIADSFEVTNEGILTANGADIQGTIKATSGEIGGFTIGESAIYNTITTFDDESIKGVYLGVDGIKLGKNFKVDDHGELNASKVILSGEITATSGTIGDATISNGVLKIGSANITDINVDDKFIVDEGGNTTIQNGKSGDEKAYIKLDSSGKISISNADIAGKITAASGEIGGFTIKDDCMYNGEVTDFTTKYEETKTGIFLGKDGIRIGATYKLTAEGATSVGENYGLDSDGNMVAKNAYVQGTIEAESGFIGQKYELDESGNYKLDENKNRIEVHKGFDIKANCIENGFYNPQTGDALINGVHVGTDCIRIGQDVTRTWKAIIGTISTDKQMSTGPHAELPIGKDILAGGSFKIKFDAYNGDRIFRIGWSRKTENGQYIVKPTSPGDYMEIAIPANSTMIETMFSSEYYTDKYHYLSFAVNSGETGFDNVSIELVTFPGFVVDNTGLLTAYNVYLRGSFQGDVNIDSGSIRIQNGENTTFEVSNTGKLTATEANIKGVIETFEGNIGGFTIDANGFHKWSNGIGDDDSILVSTGYSYAGSIGGSRPMIMVTNHSQNNYIGIYIDSSSGENSNAPTKYTWSKFESVKGYGIPYTDANGNTSYVHIEYSKDPSGAGGMSGSENPYIGIYIDSSSGEDSNDPTKYTWSKFKSVKGYGIPYTDANGNTSYVHIEYSEDPPTKWSFVVADNFGLTASGRLYATSGYIGPSEIDASGIALYRGERRGTPTITLDSSIKEAYYDNLKTGNQITASTAFIEHRLSLPSMIKPFASQGRADTWAYFSEDGLIIRCNPSQSNDVFYGRIENLANILTILPGKSVYWTWENNGKKIHTDPLWDYDDQSVLHVLDNAHNPRIRIDKFTLASGGIVDVDFTKEPYKIDTVVHQVLFASIVGTDNKTCDVRIITKNNSKTTITVYNGHAYEQSVYVMTIYI